MKQHTRALRVSAVSLVLMAMLCVSWSATAGELGAAISDAQWRHESCRFQSATPWRSWTRWEVRSTIKCAVDHWPVSLSTALYIAERESGFYAKARNPYSGACGIYQHIPRYWGGRVVAHNRGSIDRYNVAPGCENARSNILVAIRMAHGPLGWEPWGG